MLRSSAQLFQTSCLSKFFKVLDFFFFFESYHRKNKSKTWNISSGKAKHWCCFETGIGIPTCASRMYILLALSIFIPREEYIISSEQHTFQVLGIPPALEPAWNWIGSTFHFQIDNTPVPKYPKRETANARVKWVNKHIARITRRTHKEQQNRESWQRECCQMAEEKGIRLGTERV